MAELSTVEEFSDTAPDWALNGQRLNNAFGSLAAQPELISNKTIITPATGDFVLLHDISASPAALGRATLANIGTAVGVLPVGTGSSTVAAGNDTRFPASVTGLRYSIGAGSTDVAAVEANLPCAINDLGNSGVALAVPCVSFLTHKVTMTGNATLTLSGMPDGGMVRILMVQDATGNRVVTWAYTGVTFKYVGGAAVASVGANAIDIWTLHRFGSVVYVSIQKAYA